jgi:hypothetical protein
MKADTKKPSNQWLKFYDYFPEIELPVTLSEEYSSVFTKYNRPLPEELINSYILEQKLFFGDEQTDGPDTNSDELVEYVPCFHLPDQKEFFAVVYWKADLLKYEYIIHTFDKKGKSIARQIIASTTSDGNKIRQIVATIDQDLEIYVIGGDASGDNTYDPEKSKAFSLEITPDGQFIHHFEEN